MPRGVHLGANTGAYRKLAGFCQQHEPTLSGRNAHKVRKTTVRPGEEAMVRPLSPRSGACHRKLSATSPQPHGTVRHDLEDVDAWLNRIGGGRAEHLGNPQPVLIGALPDHAGSALLSNSNAT